MVKATIPAPPPPTDPVALLSTPLAASGLAAGATLRRAGIKLDFYTVRDLLFHLPRRYDDLREMHKIGELGWQLDGTVVSAQATVGDVRVERAGKDPADDRPPRGRHREHRRDMVRSSLHRTAARVGSEIVVSGKVKHFGRRLTLDNPEFQVVAEDVALLHAGRIVPVYRLTAGLTAVRLRIRHPRGARRRRQGVPRIPSGGDHPGGSARADRPGDRGGPLPGLVRGRGTRPSGGWPSMSSSRSSSGWSSGGGSAFAMQRPRSPLDATADQAIRTAIVGSLARRVGRAVELTADQATAMTAIRDDLARPTPMLRLLQGDVGSGKTAVAAHALAAIARAGLQGALLAPTDLLARQHLESVGALLEELGIGVTLLTGSLKADVKARHSRRSRPVRRSSSSARTPSSRTLCRSPISASW